MNPNISADSANSGIKRHIRRNVLLLLGFYNVALHAGIARYAQKAGWTLNDTFMRVGYPPVWWRGDGILSLITNPKDVRALECFPELPLVDLSKGWISDSMPENDRLSGLNRPRVFYDNEKIAQLAAEHFLQRGFRHIACLNIGNYWMETERIPVLRQAVEDAGASFYEIAYHKKISESAGDQLAAHVSAQQWLIQKMQELPKPLGVFISSDDVAPRLLQACEDAQISVPEDVGILGCDNDPLVCNFTPVPLSSVDVDWERIGYEAAALLDRIMDGGTPPAEPVRIAPKGVITRLSTNILAIPDPNLARAVRFIWEQFTSPIGTLEVAQAAGLNRRKLERDFQKFLGRSVAGEIMRVRIEHARKLLKTSELKIHEIAVQSGFSGVAPFSKTFLRITGQRPSEVRQHLQ